MISPLHMLALDSDVCPVPVTCPVAPLNTYTFLKPTRVCRAASFALPRACLLHSDAWLYIVGEARDNGIGFDAAGG